MAEGTATTIEAPAQNAHQQTTTATTAQETKSPLLAGKYADRSALEKGIREARKAAGFEAIPDKFPIIGEDGLFTDDAAGEREYKRLETLIAQGKKPQEPKPGEAAQALKIGGDPLPENADVPTIIARAGLKIEDVVKQFTEKGDLTDEQYKAIRAKRPGLSNADIKFIAEGLQAKSVLAEQAISKARNEAANVVGGMPQLESLLTQAKTFVPESEQAGLNAMLQNPATAVAAVKVLKQMHADHIGAGGAQPIINGTAGGPAAHNIKTFAEYKDLERRAKNGDESAWKTLATIDVSKLTA